MIIFRKFLRIASISLILILVSGKISYAQTVDPNNPGANPTPEALLEAGITQVRVVLRDPSSDGGTTLAAVQAYEAAGINVIGIVNWEYGSAGAWPQSGPGSQSSPEYISNFVNNVLPTAYNTYQSLHSYQIWNEPDDYNNPTMQGSVKLMSAESYGQLLGLSHAYLSSLSQHTTSAGLVSGNPNYLAELLQYGGSADAFAIHPYIPDPSRPEAINEVIALINAMSSAILNQTGNSAPIWITEFGWETSNEAAQAAWLLQVYQLQQIMPQQLHSVMWYGFSDVQNPGFGLFDASGRPKLAFLALIEYLSGNPISDEQLQLLLANNFVACRATNGDLMGLAFTEDQCALFRPCLDGSGNIVSYAFGPNLCNFQQVVRLACGGILDIENQVYRTEIVGFHGTQPFVLEGSVGNEGNDTDDLASSFGANLKVEVTFDHPDFSNIKDKYLGSIDPTSDLYIGNRATFERANMPLLTMQMPNSDTPAGFGIGAQGPKRANESYQEYTERVYGSTMMQGKKELGLDEDIPIVRFSACLQRAACDSSEEICFDGNSPGTIVKADGTTCDPSIDTNCIEYYDPSSNYCTSGNPEQCITAGSLFQFNGEIILEEPTALQAKARAFEDIMAKSLVDIPGSEGYTQHGSAGLIARNSKTIEEAIAINNELQQKAFALAKINTNNQNLANTKTSKSIMESISNPTEANAQVEDSLSDGSFQTTSCANGYGMSLLVENKGTYYSVKAWDTQTVGADNKACAGLFDFSWEVDYFLNGVRVGGCSSPIQAGAMPAYPDNPETCLENGSCSERDIYGMSVSDMCPVPVSPEDGELSVNFRVTNSNAPGDHVGCTKTAQCLCDGPECQAKREDLIRNVDCRVCPAWVPPEKCASVIEESIVSAKQCANGSCQATGAKIVERDIPFNFDSAWDISPSSWPGWILSIFDPILPSFLNCKKTEGYTDSSGNYRPDEYTCRMNTSNYHVYLYPTQFIADNYLNHLHMRANDALFNIPDYTDKYFDSKAATAPMQVHLNIEDFFTDNNNTKASDYNGAGAGNNFVYLGISAEAGSNRTIDVEYPNFMQPVASGYCLNQMFLTAPISENKKVPKSTAESGLCNNFDFMPGSLANRQEVLAQKYPQIFAKVNDDVFVESINKLEPRKTSFEGEFEEKVDTYLSTLSKKQIEDLQLELMTDIYTITGKNWHLRDPNNADYIPPQMQEDLEKLKVKYDKKIGL